MTKLHDLIVYGPDFEEGVRIYGCDDDEIEWWTDYAISKGATRFVTKLTGELQDPVEAADWDLDKAAANYGKVMSNASY